MDNQGRSLTILRLVTTVGETSSPYNQFSLALSGEHKIALCSYFKATVSPSPGITLFEGDGSLLGFFRAMRAALKDKEYDVIHGHMAVTGFLFLFANILNRRLLRSTVFTAHNSYQNFKFRNRLLFIPIFATFRRIVCCGQAAFESFPAFYKWLAGRRLCTIQNGVNLNRIDRILANWQDDVGNKQFTVLSVGRLINIKNPLTLLSAFRQNASPGSRLIFLGEGDLRDALLAKSKEFALEKRVELPGLIPRNKVYETLAQADLFISSSFGEGLPVAALEAMACRCPVILSDIPPHREVAAGTDFIPLIPPNDTEGFAREIGRFSRLSDAERKDIGEKCRSWVEDHFSLATMHKRYIELYEQVAS